MSAVALPRAVVRFSRPHTILGTASSIVALWILARVLAEASPTGWALCLALVGGLATNVYIVGLNQLTDVELDRINKPWLPLASGALSPAAGRALVVSALAVAAAAAATGGPWLASALGIGVIVGTAYSVPPVRLKRHHVWAAACIAGVRGLVVNLLVYGFFVTSTGGPATFPPAVVALTLVVLVAGLVIAWLKDIPDVEGDDRYRIRTLALRLGPGRALGLGVGVLAAGYLGIIAAGAAGLVGLHVPTLALGQTGMLVALLWAARTVRLGDRVSVARFYQVVWGLFYAQYAVFAVAGLQA